MPPLRVARLHHPLPQRRCVLGGHTAVFSTAAFGFRAVEAGGKLYPSLGVDHRP